MSLETIAAKRANDLVDKIEECLHPELMQANAAILVGVACEIYRRYDMLRDTIKETMKELDLEDVQP